MNHAPDEYEKLKARLLMRDGVTASQMFGKACLKIYGKAFVAQHRGMIIFKLTGTVRDKVMAQPGALLWDSSGKDRPMKEWVALTVASKKQFTLLAAAAIEFVKSSIER